MSAALPAETIFRCAGNEQWNGPCRSQLLDDNCVLCGFCADSRYWTTDVRHALYGNAFFDSEWDAQQRVIGDSVDGRRFSNYSVSTLSITDCVFEAVLHHRIQERFDETNTLDVLPHDFLWWDLKKRRKNKFRTFSIGTEGELPPTHKPICVTSHRFNE